MAGRLTFVNDIVSGRIDWKIVVRVIRLWNIPDFKYPNTINTVEMILVDQKVS